MRSASDNAMPPPCRVEDLRMSYPGRLIQEHISFELKRGEIFTIMGGSGCGKSTLLRHMIGLLEPDGGSIHYGDVDYWKADVETRDAVRRNFGVLFQGSALFSAMTLFENVALPLQLYAKGTAVEIRAMVRYKLGLVGLRGYEEFYPSEISGGMRKRAGLARALALDPELLFLDEPSAGLDPVSSRRLDDLILQLRDGTGASVVVVSHELPSLFAIGDNGIFLDADSKRPIAHGSPKSMLEHCDHPAVQAFLRRQPVQDAGTHDLVVRDNT
jgi:phospholipid/cholesterol/gamma-HCH transport system ATP-binding protein